MPIKNSYLKLKVSVSTAFYFQNPSYFIELFLVFILYSLTDALISIVLYLQFQSQHLGSKNSIRSNYTNFLCLKSTVSKDIFIQILFMISNRISEAGSNYQSTRKQSTSTCSSNSCDNSSLENEDQLILSSINGLRLELFYNHIYSSQISQKLNQRAISWIITLCWSKDFDEECLWSILLLYYCYRSQKNTKKEQLELILLSCLSLSLKMTCNTSCSMADIIALASKPLTSKDIIETEAIILQLVNYNAIIPHYISELYYSYELSAQNVDQIMLLCELFMIRDHNIFFDKEKIESFVRMIEADKVKNNSYGILAHEIKQLLSLKQCRIVINKYSSKFDVSQFISRFD